MNIAFVKGDATRPIGMGPKVLTHICNDRGGWGSGFVLAISKRWREPERAYRLWHAQKSWEGAPFALAQVQLICVQPDLHVANMISQVGYGRNNTALHRRDEPDETPPIRYEALEQCLKTVAAWCVERGASVHMPRIGCSLAGGRWSEVEPILERSLAQIPVYVYDFPGSLFNL